MRSRFIALPLAALATLAFASVALAGGWAQVTVKDAPVDPPAGGETNIELSVLQHAETAVSWPNLTVIATDATSGTVVRSQARAEGTVGTYLATIVFPSAGEWTLSFDSTDLEMGGTAAISVAPPVAAAQSGVAAPAAQAFDVLPMVVVLIATAVALAIGGLLLRSRGVAAETRVTARN